MGLLDLFNQKDKSVSSKEDPKPVLANDLTLTEDELMDLTVEERLVESGFHLFKGRYEKAMPTYDFIIDHVCFFFGVGWCWLVLVGVGCWLLVVGCWLLVVGCCFLLVGCCLLVVLFVKGGMKSVCWLLLFLITR